MVKKQNKRAEFITCLIGLVICLALIGAGIYGMVANGTYGRLWWTLIAGGLGGLAISSLGILDALGIFDYLIY